MTSTDPAITNAADDALLATRDWVEPWIGYTDAATEGAWVWVSGAPVGYERWAPDEPNDSGGAEDCAQLVSWGGWNDNACDATYRYFCELPAP